MASETRGREGVREKREGGSKTEGEREEEGKRERWK